MCDVVWLCIRYFFWMDLGSLASTVLFHFSSTMGPGSHSIRLGGVLWFFFRVNQSPRCHI